ncbi:hypothetical protein HDIA_1932 [Hartmannibacter diazotrophicus]|uniref:Uncharacterized protein n=1 Tax=Hartmannibacter diazotrophicus TaxID=1482074 RepID=A0A2C9D5H1_9HYPH|nr:hypothetical protein [Hartmannibacter diazotrophicus]SON55473.1 hypothetical protein HDIA_1932 [Hartmannibacter diazotrophicus]
MTVRTLPLLVRFLARHALIGFGIAIAFVTTILMLDIGGLGALVTSSPSGCLAAVVLTFAIGLTFSSVQMGFAIMFLADKD